MVDEAEVETTMAELPVDDEKIEKIEKAEEEESAKENAKENAPSWEEERLKLLEELGKLQNEVEKPKPKKKKTSVKSKKGKETKRRKAEVELEYVPRVVKRGLDVEDIYPRRYVLEDPYVTPPRRRFRDYYDEYEQPPVPRRPLRYTHPA